MTCKMYEVVGPQEQTYGYGWVSVTGVAPLTLLQPQR